MVIFHSYVKLPEGSHMIFPLKPPFIVVFPYLPMIFPLFTGDFPATKLPDRYDLPATWLKNHHRRLLQGTVTTAAGKVTKLGISVI
jgi:hypothetical protein